MGLEGCQGYGYETRPQATAASNGGKEGETEGKRGEKRKRVQQGPSSQQARSDKMQRRLDLDRTYTLDTHSHPTLDP